MSSTIPPLVCNTPPPIDFDHDDDDVCSEGIDSTFSPSEDDVSLPATPKHSKTSKKHVKHVSDRELVSSVPDDESIVSQHGAIPTDLDANNACTIETVDDTVEDKEIITNEIDKASSHASPIEFECAVDVRNPDAENETQISSGISIRVEIDSPPLDDNYDRNESPPSLELATAKFSDNECDMNDVNDDFDDFQRNSNELSVDTTSLPSLNFDSIRNSPDFKSDEIEEKKSEPDDVDDGATIPDEKVTMASEPDDVDEENVPDDKVTTTSNELFDGDPPPSPLDEPEPEPEPVCSVSFDPIESADPNVAEVEDGRPCDNFAAFDADFSQFSAFGSENGTAQEPQQPSVELQQTYVESKPIDDDFDDDFGDFEEAPTTESNTIEVKNPPQDAATNFNDDDDFGDFSDFRQDTASVPAPPLAEIPKSTSFDMKSISEKFKTILDTVFPTNGEDANEDVTSDPSNDTNLTNKIDSFMNETTMQLKNFENAKALQHQWTNSTGKNVLIKALGIDVRNIMYGENWKSPLPRFAANLGYNALEPLKPVAVDNSSINNNNNLAPSKSKESVNMSSAEPTIKMERSPEVPAAQFDWNSAGLVNPLDASQAHTLLLDLEQLVVMENLDKIKLDCSSSSSSSTCNASSSPLPLPIPLPPSSSSSSSSSSTNNNNNNSTKLRTLLGTVKSSAASIIDSTLPKMQKTGHNLDGFINHTTASFGRSTSNALNGLLFNHAKSTHNHNVLLVAENAYQMGQPFDLYFDISPQEIVHETNTAENQLSRTDVDRKKSIEIDSASGECGPSEIVLSAATPLPKSTTVPTTIPKGSTAQSYEMSPADMVASLNTFQPAPQSASYTVPGSSGTLKETHIFTPIKMNITSSHVPSLSNQSEASEMVAAAPAPNPYPEYDFDKASAGVIINENVVKKEYRDVEYDPDKLKATASIECDDFSEFQSVEAPAIETKPTVPSILTSSILQPTKTITNISIDWPDPGTVADTNTINEFKQYVPNTIAPSQLEPSKDGRVKHSNTNGYGFNKPTIGTSPSDDMFSQSNQVAATESGGGEDDDDGFSAFQSTKTAGISYISHISAIPDIIPTGQSFTYATPAIAPKSAAPDIFQHVSLASDMGIDKYSDTKKHSNDIHTVTSPIDATPTPAPNTVAPPPFANTSILVPQVTMQPKQAPASNHVSSIAWPDPGISADELARLETIFPQANKPKTANASPIKSSSPKQTNNANNSKAEDDEWTDFVSVTQPQTPITNILNQNLQRHQNNDDDDWSDFVSSAVPPASQPPMQIQSMSAGPNFTSWNAPSQYSSWQHTAPAPMAFSQLDNFTSSPIRSMGNGMNQIITNGHAQQQAPSIISLPNLGFAAPKTLVNMPKPNLAKK